MYALITTRTGRIYRREVQELRFTPKGTLTCKLFLPRKVVLTNAI